MQLCEITYKKKKQQCSCVKLVLSNHIMNLPTRLFCRCDLIKCPCVDHYDH